MDESIVKHLVPADLDAVSRTLLMAADIIERRGHCRGSSVGPDGSVCAIHAINVAGNFDSHAFEAKARLSERLRDSIAFWSDTSPTKTVVATLRRVALGG